ncbi:hypothetical protein PPERSA_06732 [Pseudocohnilembus persalinus]|uniref:Uncharacterized protein n=1 Tax=Pseudocohnilembus persalinus TaxID=266149 RepID=A0A0V0QSV9_PSEPJ|nr:hypothetical protein PPERSA_06732 [Pseudocohnilembus persalinus]|eukprot:KRX05098.1 hypothetical protein PPERSA_06732 [Pseudocohnilembus persalinus]
MDQTYISKNKSAKNFSYKNDTSYQYIPSSYGQQYKKYHNELKNKPFSQQEGIYLYDVYDQKQKIMEEQELQDFYKKEVNTNTNINNKSISQNNQQYPQLNILDELNNSKLSYNQSQNLTFNKSFSTLSINQNQNNLSKLQNTNSQLNMSSLLLNRVPNTKNINYSMRREFQENKTSRNNINNDKKNGQPRNQSFSLEQNINPNLAKTFDLSQNEYYNTFKSKQTIENQENSKNSQFLNNTLNQSLDQNEVTFTSNLSKTTQLPIIKHKRTKKPLVLTRDTKSQSTLFQQIAKENIFTNISFAANKDYDQNYDLQEGFAIHLDLLEVTFPASQIKNLTLNYEIINKETKDVIWQQNGKQIQYKDIFKQKIPISHRQLLKNLPLDENFYFIIYSNYDLIDIENRMETQFSTFSLLPIFKNQKLNSGKHNIKFLQFCGSRHPILSLEGYQFPCVQNLNCFIRICNPESYLDRQDFVLKNLLKQQTSPNKFQYKQDETIERKEREEIDGFWATRAKKQQQQIEQQKRIKVAQSSILTYKEKKKLENENNRYNLPSVSFDLYKPSNYANFQTQIQRKPAQGIQQNGKFKIQKYY